MPDLFVEKGQKFQGNFKKIMSIFTISRKSYDGISGIDIFVYKIKRLSNSKISSSTNLEFFRIMRASCNLSTFLKIDQFPLINFIYYKIFREGGLWLGNAIWNSTQELIQYYNSLPGNFELKVCKSGYRIHSFLF